MAQLLLFPSRAPLKQRTRRQINCSTSMAQPSPSGAKGQDRKKATDQLPSRGSWHLHQPMRARAKIGPSAFSAHTCIRLRRQLPSRKYVLHVSFTLRYYISYNPSFLACFFSQNSVYLSQQISQNSVLVYFFSEANGADKYKDYVINANT